MIIPLIYTLFSDIYILTLRGLPACIQIRSAPGPATHFKVKYFPFSTLYDLPSGSVISTVVAERHKSKFCETQ